MGVGVGVEVGLGDGEGEGVLVAVEVAVLVAVEVAVLVGVAVGVAEGVAVLVVVGDRVGLVVNVLVCVAVTSQLDACSAVTTMVGAGAIVRAGLAQPPQPRSVAAAMAQLTTRGKASRSQCGRPRCVSPMLSGWTRRSGEPCSIPTVYRVARGRSPTG